ncbi:MAG: hypothetical protein OXB99_06515 [Acidimicrobiaceae bacterium]|nr:hypothetical protein [Acidimicrobiaceae bacterium]
MQYDLTGDNRPFARSTEAADQVFNSKSGSPSPSFEPDGVEEARVAIERLGERWNGAPGSLVEALENAGSSGSLLSSDRFQGLAEIIQNADDVKASEVRFMLGSAELLASHDGSALRLRDVHAMSIPWLGTKAGDPIATGRFGVGLSTLRALSRSFEVHCAPYHVKIGDPTVAWVRAADLPPHLCESGWTTLRIPLQQGAIEPQSLEDWFSQWDDSALLFLRNVSRVALLDPNGGTTLQLELKRHSGGNSITSLEFPTISREHISTSDGRLWTTYGAEVPTPRGVQRAGKATGLTTSISVAFPHNPTETGQICVGLPAVRTSSPYFVNAQFDPVANRSELANNPWNEALVGLVAAVWSKAAVDLFEHDPQIAWQSMPLPYDNEGRERPPVILALEQAILEHARRKVASRVSLRARGQQPLNLSRFAIEAQPLEGILQEAEIAELAGLSVTLPAEARDPTGRWRSVLDDWRDHGADLPRQVGIEQALRLVGDEERPVASSIALVAVALDEGFGARLLELPCVVARDGRRLVPPAADSVMAVSAESSLLAAQLGVTTLLHPDYLATNNGAPEVLAWLRECEVLLTGGDDGEVLHRLAKAGRRGGSLDAPLTDEQLRALRNALERLAPETQEQLGPGIGRAVRLETYTFDDAGRKQVGADLPAIAYLPRAIETRTDSFAAAAATAPGPVWLSGRYRTVLRREDKRGGIGARTLLRLLGAETAPRLRPHPSLNDPSLRKVYSNDERRGLPKSLATSPESRVAAMQERSATYTLEDHDCPDLLAVITDISRERRGVRRRERAGALLSALGRAWALRLSDYAEVDAAIDSWGWKFSGKIPAFWLAQAGDIAWLDDKGGVARKPAELRIRTPGTVALDGEDWPDFLHADLDSPAHRAPLAALGTSGDPSRSELVARLRQLRRESQQDDVPSADVRHGAELVYRALARSVGGRSTESDLNIDQLRREFDRNRLVCTDQGWFNRSGIFAGPPVFGRWRSFAPAARECGALWRALQISTPSAEDCVAVIKEITYRRRREPDRIEQAVLLETMRTLAERLERGDIVEREKLRRLALWTGTRWERSRPVYATDDPVLTVGLRDRVPIWQPGGDLEQFRSLLEPLRITEIRAGDSRVVDPEYALLDYDLTANFRRAVALLRDEMQRNLPDLAHGITGSSRFSVG